MSKENNPVKAISFKLPENQEYIDLLQLLKATNICQTGGHAKMMVDEGLIQVNEELESRRRRKIYRGFTVKSDAVIITIS